MSLTLITPPTALPVSLADVKLHLKVEHSADDALIATMIKSAARLAQQRLNRALMTQTWQLVLDEFPLAEMKLPMPRVQSVVSITYVDAAGADQSIAPSGYKLDPDFPPGWVFPAIDTDWPATRAQANAVKVTFVSGYGDTPASVPEDVAMWLLLEVGGLYRNREGFAAGVSVSELPGRFHDGLLDGERLYW